MNNLLSIIVPAYNEEGMVSIAAGEISRIIGHRICSAEKRAYYPRVAG